MVQDGTHRAHRGDRMIMSHTHRRSIFSATLLSMLASHFVFAADRPNIVFILTDNHGAWTLGCYGNNDIRTPNIDRLAAEGMRFTRAMSSNPVCSPTRATYLTGLMPSQHGLHSFLDNKYMMGPEAYYTLEEFETLPEILHSEGYICGLSGKWHLGANMTPQDGFSKWITMVRGSTRNFYDDMIIQDGVVKKTPKYMTNLWTEHAIEFIEQNKENEKPFFLYLAYNGPYCLGSLLLEPARNRHAAYYAYKELPSFPRDTIHPWQYNNKTYHNNLTSIRRVAAEVSGVDDGVGSVMAALSEHGLDENTIVIFAGDQGWMGGQNGFLWHGRSHAADRSPRPDDARSVDLPSPAGHSARNDRYHGQQYRLPTLPVGVCGSQASDSSPA